MVFFSDVDTGLTATGNSQATALPVNAPYNQFASVPAGTGARLSFTRSPGGISGGISANVLIEVVNDDPVNALLVYPPVGSAINGGAVNAAAQVTAGTAARFLYLSPAKVRVI